MIIYKFTITAERERFMERPLRDTFECYVLAYSYDQAHGHVWRMLENAGWKIEKIEGKTIHVQDIRDFCDQVNNGKEVRECPCLQ